MNVKKIASNAKWIIACKIVQSLLQLLIGMLSARYLGPANYGLMNYAKSVVSFAVPVTQLGLNATLVRELIDMPDREGEVLGTSLVISFISSLACVASVWMFTSVVNYGEAQTILVCVLYSVSLMFQAIELTQYWFQSKLESKYPSMMMLVSYVVVSAYKIFLLIAKKNIYWFAVVYSIEFGIIGLSLLGIYTYQKNQKLCFSVGMAKYLISRSYPYIFSSLMVTLFQNTDHVMLKMISGDAENGLYSAAITCSSVAAFVYAAIVDSMRPAILTSKKMKSDEYGQGISTLYCIIIYMALAQGVVFTLFAKQIIMILYGMDYIKTVPVLQALVWYISFANMGRIRNIWILAEGKQHLLWKINLLGALANIAVNAVLIPIWGALGAALASLMTQMFVNFFLGFMVKQLHEINRFMLRGLNPKYLCNLVKKYLKHI